MEEGSLLQEALEYMERLRRTNCRTNNNDNNNNNEQQQHDAIQIDVYDLEMDVEGRRQSDTDTEKNRRIVQFQRLSQLAFDFNKYITESSQDDGFLWHVGFPPFFGIHVSTTTNNRIPHLRGICHYGDNVNDEWMVIRYMMELSKLYPTVGIHCWDVDVGPILLIEGSDGLPHWLSEERTTTATNDDDNNDDETSSSSRYIDWIVRGTITLIGPNNRTPLTLDVALDSLRRGTMTSTSRKVQAELSKTVFDDSLVAKQQQRTAFVVPRRIARLLRRMPEVANAAAVAYVQSSPTTVKLERYENDDDDDDDDDWVWTTSTLARTNYAMLRTVMTRQGPGKLSVQQKRLARTCANEATPHLRHALEMGLRLTAGIESLLKSSSTTTMTAVNKQQQQQQLGGDDGILAWCSPMERRIVQYWTDIDVQCGGDGLWLQDAWRLGPRNSSIDMTYILKCPVFKYEHEYPFPISRPGVTTQEVIRSGMKKRTVRDDEEEDRCFVIPPGPDDVDDELWFHRGEEALQEAVVKRGLVAGPSSQDKADNSTFDFASEMEVPNEEQLDSLLCGFQQFMAGESEIEGIANNNNNDPARREHPGLDEPIRINPRVFLNLLHDVLKSSPEDLARNLNGMTDDPFFSKEDYDLMEPNVPCEDESSSNGSEEMQTIMEAMDAELASTSASRAAERSEVQDIPDQNVANDATALSNLMRSLGASQGAPGPVTNILKEMGVEPPKIRSEDMEATSDEE